MDQRTTLQPLEWRSSKRQTITREEEEQSYIVTEIVTRCSHCGKKFSSSSKYRYTLPHHHIFYFASQILCFSQKAVLWQSRIKQVCWRHFSNSVDSLCVSMPLLAILAIFQTFAFYYCIFFTVIWDQWSLMLPNFDIYWKKNIHVPYLHTHFIGVVWIQTFGISKVCMPAGCGSSV